MVCSLDRIGRQWFSTLGAAADLCRRGVKIRDTGRGRTAMGPVPSHRPQHAGGRCPWCPPWDNWTLTERRRISARTKEGLEKARRMGRSSGAPLKLNEASRDALRDDREAGMSWGEIKKTWGVAKSTAQRIVAEEVADEDSRINAEG